MPLLIQIFAGLLVGLPKAPYHSQAQPLKQFVDLRASFGPNDNGITTVSCKFKGKEINVGVWLDKASPCYASAEDMGEDKTGSIQLSDELQIPVVRADGVQEAALHKLGLQAIICSSALKDWSFGYDVYTKKIRIWKNPKLDEIKAWVNEGLGGEPNSEPFETTTTGEYCLRIKRTLNGQAASIGLTTSYSVNQIDVSYIDKATDLVNFGSKNTLISSGYLVWEKSPYGSMWNWYSASPTMNFSKTYGCDGILGWDLMYTRRVAISGQDSKIYTPNLRFSDRVVGWFSKFLRFPLHAEGNNVVYRINGNLAGIEHSEGDSMYEGCPIISLNGSKMADLLTWARTNDPAAQQQLIQFAKRNKFGEFDFFYDDYVGIKGLHLSFSFGS